MSLLNFKNQKHYTPKSKHNKRLTQDQVRLLEISFSSNKKLEPELKLQLAGELGIPPRQIAIWYQNKRARWKAQSLELDYSALQLRLETALAQKRWLEKEAERLRGELEKANMVLVSLKQQQPAPAPSQVSCLSSCCDEGAGSSSLVDDVSGSWVSDQVLQLEDLYACIMGADSSNCA